MLSILAVPLVLQSDSLELLLTRLSWLRTTTHPHHLSIFDFSSFSRSATFIWVSTSHFNAGLAIAIFGRLLLAQRLLTLESGSNRLHGILKILRRRVFDVSRKWLVLGLELLVLTALGPVHHTFDVEYVCKIFVGVERRVNWFQGFDRARWTHMFTFSCKSLVLRLVDVSDVDARAVIAQIVWSQSASTNVFGKSGIRLTLLHLFFLVSVVEVLATATIGISWRLFHSLGKILGTAVLVRVFRMGTPVDINWLLSDVGRLLRSLLLNGFLLCWRRLIDRFGQPWRIDSKLLFVLLL